MKVVIASTFRDSTSYLGRYLEQVASLRAFLEGRGDHVTYLWGEGDSTDETAIILRGVSWDAVVDVSTGHRYCPSHEDSDARWANVARFCNLLLDEAPVCDVLLWVESDLIWTVDSAAALIDQAVSYERVVAAPVWRNDTFYDLWGVRRLGEPFTPPRNDGLHNADSACGMAAIPGTLLDHRFPPEDAARGWIRTMGGCLLDTDHEVEHP